MRARTGGGDVLGSILMCFDGRIRGTQRDLSAFERLPYAPSEQRREEVFALSLEENFHLIL